MTKKTKIWKTGIQLVVSLTFFMMVATSVSAERTEEAITRFNEIPVDDSSSNDLTDDLLISPGPEEPLIIAPNPDEINEELVEPDDLVIAGKTTEQTDISTMALPAFVIIAVIIGISASIVLIKRK